MNTKSPKPIAYIRVFSDAMEIIRKGNTSVINHYNNKALINRKILLQQQGFSVHIKYMEIE